MGKVFFDVVVCLDEFIAGLNGGPNNPLVDGGLELLERCTEHRPGFQRIKEVNGKVNE